MSRSTHTTLRYTGLDHPGREAVIGAGQTDWRMVAQQLTGPLPTGIALSYQKHMTHHLLPHIGREWLRGLTHAFLIRDPRRVLVSYIKSRPNVVAADIGILQQREIYEYVRGIGTASPPVLDAGRVPAGARGPAAGPVRRAWGRLHTTDAHLARGATAQRRRVGAALVRTGLSLDGLRGASRRGARSARAVP